MDLNLGRHVPDWIGIRLYEPDHKAGGEVMWHLRWNPSDNLKNILTNSVYDGHAFFIKDIAKYSCVHCCTCFPKQRASNDMQMDVHKGRHLSSASGSA